MNRTALAIILVPCCLLTACGSGHQAAEPPASPISSVTSGHQAADPTAAPAVASPGAPEVQPLTIDLQANPNLQVRIDSFSVPDASRSEFETTMHKNAAFLAKLPGFEGHVVFEKASGPTTFNIVSIAAWQSPEAMKSAGEKVREEYQRTGFDMQGTIARWGVTASIGNYRAPMGLQ